MKRGYSQRRFGLIGEHLGHSFSKPIHNRLGDYSFAMREVEKHLLGDFMQSNELEAFCVTIPYKKDVIPYLNSISPEAQKFGAVNVVVRGKDDKLYGYNTDYFGFEYMMNSAGIDPQGKSAIVLGRGGASMTVCAVLRDRGASRVTVLGSADNTPENISKLSDAEIVVNATPVGMYPNNGISPIDLSQLPSCEAVLDLIYNPARTALLLQAEQRGIKRADGLSMLVAQAARAFELFTGDPYEEGCIEKIISEIRRNAENVILVGMPGSGKSTVGDLLANALNRPFFDADSVFAERYGITPANAINTLGEEKFRNMEHDVLCELGKANGTVISTGGGAVTRANNYDPLHQNGIIVFIERPLDKLSTEGRPLSLSKPVQQLYSERIDCYLRFADVRIDNDNTPEATVEKILSAIEKRYS